MCADVLREERIKMEKTGLHFGTAVSIALLTVLLLPQLSLAQQQQRRGGGSMFEGFEERTPAPGEIAPDFTLKTLEGEEFSLSAAYTKGPVVIEFGSFT